MGVAGGLNWLGDQDYAVHPLDGALRAALHCGTPSGFIWHFLNSFYSFWSRAFKIVPDDFVEPEVLILRPP